MFEKSLIFSPQKQIFINITGYKVQKMYMLISTRRLDGSENTEELNWEFQILTGFVGLFDRRVCFRPIQSAWCTVLVTASNISGTRETEIIRSARLIEFRFSCLWNCFKRNNGSVMAIPMSWRQEYQCSSAIGCTKERKLSRKVIFARWRDATWLLEINPLYKQSRCRQPWVYHHLTRLNRSNFSDRSCLEAASKHA